MHPHLSSRSDPELCSPSYWLVKSEPATYSIEKFAGDRTTWWDGVRNYQARNFLRSMKQGDYVLFYHSSVHPPAVVGLGQVSQEARADASQFNKESPYFDPKATRDKPRWFCPELTFVSSFNNPVSLESLKENSQFAELPLVQRGNRLSVMPLSCQHFTAICSLGGCPIEQG